MEPSEPRSKLDENALRNFLAQRNSGQPAVAGWPLTSLQCEVELLLEGFGEFLFGVRLELFVDFEIGIQKPVAIFREG